MARLPKGWGAAFNLINPQLRHVLKGMISSTWAPQLSVLYFPCCDTHLCVSNSFQRLSAILGKREKEACSQVDILTDLPHSTTSSSSAAVAGAEQFPYPISFDFLPSSSCHGCDCDAISTRPFIPRVLLKRHEVWEGLAWNLSTNQMQNVDLQSGQKFLDTTCMHMAPK